jgi:hypothetical protein
MRGPEGFNGGNPSAEARHDPEVEELLEFLGAYKKIQEILSWLAEASAGSDPIIKGVRRGHMHRLMQQLGLDPESPVAFTQLEEIKLGLSDRTVHPKPRIEVPEAGYFRSRIKEIISDREKFGAPFARLAIDGDADIVAVAQYGHTDWANVKSRTGSMDTAAWVRGVAMIMADPVAYQAEFAGLGIDPSHKTADHLAINETWIIQNGRHRSLAAVSLGEEYLHEAGMAQWIPVKIEQP